MKQNSLPVSGPMILSVEKVGGDLQIVGWERPEITAKTDGSELIFETVDQNIRVRSNGDLILYVAREVDVQIAQVGGDADVRALVGSSEIAKIGGDLQMRNVGTVHVKHVGGDMSLRGCSGDLLADSVGGDASLHEIRGTVKVIVGADLYLRNAQGNVDAKVGADAALYLHPLPGMNVYVKAGSDILLRLPEKADVELSLQGCDDESIRVDLAGVDQVQVGMERSLVVGNGGSNVTLVAGSEVIVTSRNEEWESVAEFDPLGREGPFAPGEFPGLSSELHERISQRVEDATRRAMEQSGKVQRRVDAAMRRADEKMRSAEQRSMHMGIKVGRFGARVDMPHPPTSPIPPIPPISPLGQRQAAEPVTDAERLMILKMLQEKKISLQEAEKLLATLEGK